MALDLFQYELLQLYNSFCYIKSLKGENSNERGLSEIASLRPSGGFLFPLEVFVFLPRGKAKSAERQGREITGLIGDNRIALKKLVRLFFSKRKIKLIKKITIPKKIKITINLTMLWRSFVD